MSEAKRPEKGDRWQNRHHSRVAVVEAVYVRGSGSLVAFRYEQRTPNARATKLQTTSVGHFMATFSLFERSSQ